jgi:hypothetical protein
MWAAQSSYLLLQAHYAGPLLLEQALILPARRIVERVGDIDLLPKGSGRVGRIDDAQVGDYGLVSVTGVSRWCGAVEGQGVLTALPPVGQSESRSWRRQPAATIHWRLSARRRRGCAQSFEALAGRGVLSVGVKTVRGRRQGSGRKAAAVTARATCLSRLATCCGPPAVAVHGQAGARMMQLADCSLLFLR